MIIRVRKWRWIVASKKRALRAEWCECVEATIRFCLEGHSMSWSLRRRTQRNGCVGLPKHNRGFKGKDGSLFWMQGILGWQKLQVSGGNPCCAHGRKSCLVAIKSSSTTFTPSLPFVVFHPFDLTTISERIHECQMCGCGGGEWESGHYLLNGCLFDVTGDCV